MNFDELNLAPAILRAVQEQGYTAPTPIHPRLVALHDSCRALSS